VASLYQRIIEAHQSRSMLIAGRLGALEERDFRLLWLGQATSALGSSLVPVALAFAVIGLTGSASALGLVLSAASFRVCSLPASVQRAIVQLTGSLSAQWGG
jgi:hypothetical protein